MLEPFKEGNGAAGLKRLWCIYTVEYYSAPKRNEISPFVTAGMDPEGIMLSTISRRHTTMISLTRGI